MEPAVSVPNDSGPSQAATAAVEPPDEPPGTRAVSHGLRGDGWKADDSLEDPKVNSSRLTFPKMTAPASSRRSTAVAVYGAIKFSRILEPAVDGVPCTQKISLIVTGTPASGPAAWPAAILRSTASACARARSPVSVIKACTLSASALRSPPIVPGKPSTLWICARWEE